MEEGSRDWAERLLRGGPAGIEQWNRWRDTNPVFLDLSGIDLRNAQLSGVNLRGIKLWDALLCGADLSNALLAGAYLNGANLQNARLDGANLGAANLRRAQLGGASITGAHMRYALHLTSAQLNASVGVAASLPERSMVL